MSDDNNEVVRDPEMKGVEYDVECIEAASMVKAAVVVVVRSICRLHRTSTTRVDLGKLMKTGHCS